jgi:F-type H+-transporting ATPase subunit delta
MNDAQLDRLETVLAKSYGQSLKLNVEVDPSILGGIKVQVAGEILDGSLASRLTAAKLQLA